MEPKKLPRYEHCFVCGKRNPVGLDLTFCATEDLVYTELEIPQQYTGFADRVHGGIISAIIDETMGWSCTTRTGRMYYTSELKVKFKQPVPAGRPVRFEGTCTAVKRWVAWATGRVVGPDGEVCAQAEGTFCAVPNEMMDEILSYLETETPEGNRPAQADDLVV